MKIHAGKTVIVHVLKILYSYTSARYSVTQTDIVRYLNDMDILCSRKTVGRNLRYLMDVGVPIRRRSAKGGGYYYDHERDRFFVKWQPKEENA